MKKYQPSEVIYGYKFTRDAMLDLEVNEAFDKTINYLYEKLNYFNNEFTLKSDKVMFNFRRYMPNDLSKRYTYEHPYIIGLTINYLNEQFEIDLIKGLLNKAFYKTLYKKMKKVLDRSDALEELIWKYFETFQEVTGDFELLIGERSDIIF